jgi:hypothetical protein
VDAVQDEVSGDSCEPSDRINYFVLVAYFLRFTRAYSRLNQKSRVKANELSSELVYVAAALQITQFELIY